MLLILSYISSKSNLSSRSRGQGSEYENNLDSDIQTEDDDSNLVSQKPSDALNKSQNTKKSPPKPSKIPRLMSQSSTNSLVGESSQAGARGIDLKGSPMQQQQQQQLPFIPKRVSESEQRDIDDFEEEERKLLAMESQVTCSPQNLRCAWIKIVVPGFK